MALLIGNDSYQETPLRNAVNDAQALGLALKDLGFEVEIVTNADLRKADQAVDRFIHKLRETSVAVFFYAGHGIQVDGANYLLPTDFTAEAEADAKYRAQSASEILDRIQRTHARTAILVLDACRNNPFRIGSRAFQGGLATMSAGRGTFIAFATGSGQTASDSAEAGGHGLFSACLLESLTIPDLGLSQLFDQTRARVYSRSDGKQLPWSANSMVSPFIFRDLSSQLRKAEAIHAQAEAELAAAMRDRGELQRQLGAEAAQQQERMLREKLAAHQLEVTRLSTEKARHQRLAEELDLLAAENAAQSQQRELERRQTEAQIAQLQARLAKEAGVAQVEQAKAMNMAEAIRDRRLIEEQLGALRARVQEAGAQAAQAVAQRYEGTLGALAARKTKDPFETSATHRDRVAALDAEIAITLKTRSLETDQAASLADRAGAALIRELEARLKRLQEAEFDLPDLQIDKLAYDPDARTFSIHLRSGDMLLAEGVEAGLAKDWFAHRSYLRVGGRGPYSESGPDARFRFALVDPALPAPTTFRLEPAPTRVKVSLRVGSSNPMGEGYKVFVDGQLTKRIVQEPEHGFWSAASKHELELLLSPGPHQLRIIEVSTGERYFEDFKFPVELTSWLEYLVTVKFHTVTSPSLTVAGQLPAQFR